MTDTPMEVAAQAIARFYGGPSTIINVTKVQRQLAEAAINAYHAKAAQDEATIERCCEAVHAEGDKPMFSNRSIVSAVIKAIAEGKPSR